MCFVEVIDTAGQGTFLVDTRIHVLFSFCRRVCSSPGSMGSVNINRSLLFRVILNISARSEGQGFILVYSIASRSTFDRLEIFRQAMQRIKQGKPVFMLVGNKCDTTEREVSRDEGVALARQFGCEFIETSAKTAVNVERLFIHLVRALRKTQDIEPIPSIPGKSLKRKCIIF